MEKPSNVCFGSDEFTQTVAIRTTILAHNNFCGFCIRGFDVYRKLKFFLVIPHIILPPQSRAMAYQPTTNSDFLYQDFR